MFVIDPDRFGQNTRFAPAPDVPRLGSTSFCGERLASLDGSSLRDRFYSWRGTSGRRHVCSVFPVDQENVVAGFSQAVVIGVARSGSERRPVCLLLSEDFCAAHGRAIRRDARALGVDEWHVHFRAEQDDDMLSGLASALLN
jgi:hypothetical protein